MLSNGGAGHDGSCRHPYNGGLGSRGARRELQEPLEEEPGKGPGETPAKEASPSAPGKRPPGRFPQQRRKKRREGGEGPETPPPRQNSFVIRLFDRSVELGQFPAGTPLYPVCRAWIGHSPAPAPAPEQVRPYRWREAAQRQQQRYGPSLRLLRLIYERQ
uniref:protein lin-37 homolog n=1 Tax=Lonchura striata TaxID=40157 RepID=UPI000B4C4EDC|nr:protein lin-37 homolog [Lonchura striata domestica]